MPSSASFPLHNAAVIALASATLLMIAIGRLPGFRLSRAAVAAAGGGLMMALQNEGFQALWRSIDGPVLVLLLLPAVQNGPGAAPALTLAMAST